MKVETLLVIVAVGAIVYFATRTPAAAAPTTIVERESDTQTIVKTAGGLLGKAIDLFTEADGQSGQVSSMGS